MSPTLLNATEFMAILGLSRTQFYKLAAEGAFNRFKVHPPIGRRCYSAYLVERWSKGEIVLAPTFAKKRSA